MIRSTFAAVALAFIAGAAVRGQGVPPFPADKRTALTDPDLVRAVVAYRVWYPTVSMAGMMAGPPAAGIADNDALMVCAATPRQRVFTANSDTPYGGGVFDLRRTGPLVIDLPPGLYVGVVCDRYHGWVMDVGLTGAEGARGGKLLVLPPDSTLDPPAGYRVGRSPSEKITLAMRALPLAGDLGRALAALGRYRVYPLAQAANPSPLRVVDASPTATDCTCLAWEDNLQFWRVLHGVLADEPARPEHAAQRATLVALGVDPAKPFAPDEPTRHLLERAARAGRDHMLAAAFASTRADRVAWPDRRWEWAALVSDNATFQTPAGFDAEAADRWFGHAVLTSPAMFRRQAGTGMVYWLAARDASGAYLDGGKAYTLRVPTPVPASLCWSVTAYDAQTRSQVETDQNRAALRSLVELKGATGAGEVELHFGPHEPPGAAGRWVKTTPGRGWFAYFRIYGPGRAAFDGTWKPGDLVAGGS